MYYFWKILHQPLSQLRCAMNPVNLDLDVDPPTWEYATFGPWPSISPPPPVINHLVIDLRIWTSLNKIIPYRQGIWKIRTTENCENEHPENFHQKKARCTRTFITFTYYAGCTLSLSAFGESLGRELPETRLGEWDSLHSCREFSILTRDMRRQPGETRDPLTRASQTAKKARP